MLGHRNFIFPLVFLFSVFGFSSTSFSQAWYENNEPAPDNEWTVSEGDFGIIQLLTLDPEEFFENWQKPTEGVNITTADTVIKGQPIVAVVLFTGCQSDEVGNCDLEVNYKMIDPNGEVYAETGFIELWKNKPAPNQGILGLGVNYLGTVIEPEDQLGEYIIYATVKDLHSEIELVSLQRFSAVEE